MNNQFLKKSALRSYLKTIVPSSILAVTLLCLVLKLKKSPEISSVIIMVLSILTLVIALVALSGIVVLWRTQQQKLHRDLFLKYNKNRSEAALGLEGPPIPYWRQWYRGLIRTLTKQQLLVGDIIEIRSFEEIRRTLDSKGCLDGMPFMPEMIPHCGKKFRVFRCVDKVYDYGGKKNLRRLRDTVLLTGLRCDGNAHDSCQAACYLMWKSAWLKPSSYEAIQKSSTSVEDSNWLQRLAYQDKKNERCYMCQYTQVVPASSPMSLWDIRQDLRPVVFGNVTLRAFLVAIFTRLFNFIQTVRGGSSYPDIILTGNAYKSTAELKLQPGERVKISDKEVIAANLNSNYRNFGLLFVEEEMLRYSNNTYPVLMRVERIIDDKTCRMLQMKTPGIVLEGVHVSGEGLRFCPQSDYPYWREAWLERDPDTK